MNTLQMIKARTTRSRAIQLVRLQMAKAFGSADHIDDTHTPLGSAHKPQCATAALLTTLFNKSSEQPVEATFDTSA